jgi:hypothetical protein
MFIITKLKNGVLLAYHLLLLFIVGVLWIVIALLQQNPAQFSSLTLQDDTDDHQRHAKRSLTRLL